MSDQHPANPKHIVPSVPFTPSRTRAVGGPVKSTFIMKLYDQSNTFQGYFGLQKGGEGQPKVE
jgi:hypothetical protein